MSEVTVNDLANDNERLRDRDVQAAVREFHETFGLPMNDAPTLDVGETTDAMRIDILREELDEYAAAIAAGDIVEVADALADMVYVIYGTALTYGIDLDAVLAEVHRSNMTKRDDDGRPYLRGDGKVVKGPNFEPPDIAAALDGDGS